MHFFGPWLKMHKYFTHTKGPYQISAKFKNRFLGRKITFFGRNPGFSPNLDVSDPMEGKKIEKNRLFYPKIRFVCFFGPRLKMPKYFTHTEGPYQRSAKFKNRFLGRKITFFGRNPVFSPNRCVSDPYRRKKGFFEKALIFRPNNDLSQGGCRRSEIPRKKWRKLVTTVLKKLLTRSISKSNKKIGWALSGFQKKSH